MNIHTYIDYIDDPNDTYEQYLEFKGINGSDNDRKIVIYTRVSTNWQKDDLKNLQILTDDSCSYYIYEATGCKRIFDTTIKSKEYGEDGKMYEEKAYIYEKVL